MREIFVLATKMTVCQAKASLLEEVDLALAATDMQDLRIEQKRDRSGSALTLSTRVSLCIYLSVPWHSSFDLNPVQPYQAPSLAD